MSHEGETLTFHKRTLMKFLGILAGGLFLLFQFNNCSKYKQPGATEEQTSLAPAGSYSLTEDPLLNFKSTGDLCEDDIKKQFLTGYYPLVRTNCATCHMQDPDKPQFASKDYDVAWAVFKSKGYLKISDHAVNPSHNPPYTGLHLLTEVSSLKSDYAKGLELYNICKGLPAGGIVTDPNLLTVVQTTQKSIPVLAVDESVDMVWDLTNELESTSSTVALGNFGASAKVKVTVTHRMTTGGEEYYTVKAPRIYDNSTGVIAQGLWLKLNTRFVMQQTTFKYMKAAIPANTPSTDPLSLLATGAMVLLGKPTNADTLRLSFEVLKDGVVQPPPPPALVKFTNANVRIIDPNVNDPSQYQQTFQIQAAGVVDRSILVTATDVTETVCGQTSAAASYTVSNTCFPSVYAAMQASSATGTVANMKFYNARPIVGASGYNRFDWDFKIVSDSLSLISAQDAGGNLIANPSGNITIKFSKDVRYENANRLLRIRISTPSTNATVAGAGAVSEVYVVFLKVNNPNPKDNFEVSYSELMNPTTGILGTKCIKCHNSINFNGGYDITDYEQMISRGILIPNDTNSLMYRRTNASDPSNIGLSPMPANGGLSDTDRQNIANWITSGAKNN